MTDSSVAADLLQSLDIHSDISAEITLNHNVKVFNSNTDLIDFLVGQISDAGARIDTCFCKDLARGGTADSKDIGQTDLNSLLSW